MRKKTELDESSNGKTNKIEENIRALEEEMRQRYGERTPCVLKPPHSVYRSYEAPAFWHKMKRVFFWGGIPFGLYLLFLPTASSVPLEGKLIAREMRQIEAKLGGEIVLIAKSSNDIVNEGEVIAQTHNLALHQELDRLRAEIRISDAKLEGARQNLKLEEKLLVDLKRLVQVGGLARGRLKLQEIKVEEAKSMVNTREAEWIECQIRIRNLARRLEDEIVRSPFKGILTSRLEEKLNTYVEEGETLAEGAVGGMQFEFRVKEKAVQSIKEGQLISITLEAFPGKRFKGRIEEVRPIVVEDNPKPWTKSYNARVLVSPFEPLPEEARLGMSAKSKVRLEHRMSRVVRWLDEWNSRIRT